MSLDVVTLGVVCADVMAHPVRTLPNRGELAFVPSIDLRLGGLAGVTAVVMCRLGGKAGFIGRVGKDGFGDFLVNRLTSLNVDVRHVRRTDTKGTSATMVLIEADGERSFLHSTGANAELCETDVDFDYVSQAKVLHWGGPALNPGLDGEPMGRVFKRAKELGLTTSMDTVYDGSGVWFPHIAHALPHLDIVMASEEEARNYSGRDEPEAMANFFLAHGPRVVMIKRGENGILVKDGKGAWRIPAHSVEVLDTTGAGDAACAGFLYGYVNGWTLEQSGRLANAVGAMTVQVMGGAEAPITLERAQALMGDRS